MSRPAPGPDLSAGSPNPARSVRPASTPTQRDGTAVADQGWSRDPSGLAALEAPALEHVHAVLGNDLVLDSLSGADLGGLGPLVAGEVAGSVAGVDTGGFSTSNATMARAMRDAIDQEGVRALNDLRIGAGMPLPALHRERMERAFDHEFDHVRIHNDAKAAHAAQAIHAHAFAIGSNIFFGRGTWSPGSASGDRLLAHELTHVVQWDQGRIAPKGSDQDSVSSPSDPLEREAYGNESRILARLQGVDSEIRAEATAPTQADLDAADQATETAVDADDEEQVELVTAPEPEAEQAPAPVEIDAPTAAPVDLDDSVLDVPEVEVAPTPVVDVAEPELDDAPADAADPLDLDGFAAALPPGGADDGMADAADDDGTALRDARGPAPARRGEAREHIRRSRGVPLGPDLATRMSMILGHDVSDATLHTDPAAARAAEALNARAFALGSDVFFAEGAFQPGTTAGDELLAHELQHVVQHDQGRVGATPGELEVSSPDDSLEREARQAATEARQAPEIEAGVPDAIASRISAAMGVQAAPVGPAGPSDLDTMAGDLGAGAFAFTGATVEASTASVDDAGLALRETTPTLEGADIAPPEELTFLIASRELVLDAKEFLENLPQEVTIPIEREPVPGLKLTLARLSFSEAAEIEQGAILGELKIGDFEAKGGVELDVDKDYNVTLEAKGLELQVGAGEKGGGLLATADVTLTRQQLTATVHAHIQEPLSLGNGVEVTTASMDGEYKDAKLHLEGVMNMRFGEYVEGELQVSYDAETDTGSVDANLDLRGESETGTDGKDAKDGGGESPAPAPTPAPGVDTETEELDGKDSLDVSEGEEQDEGAEEQSTVPAPVALDVPAAGIWNMTGTLLQTKDVTRGDVTLKNSKMSVDVSENTLAVVKGSAELETPNLTGKVSGEYDVPGEALHGTGRVDLKEPIVLEELGVEVDQLSVEATVKANRLEQLRGSLHAVMDFEEQPTFDITGEDFLYDFENDTFSGGATVKTTRALDFGGGDEGGTKLTIAEEASAEGTVEESKLKSVEGGLDYTVSDEIGDFGSGTISLKWSDEAEEGGVSGHGDFTMDARYGMPAREEGPLYIEPGSSLSLDIEESQPSTAEMDDVKLTWERPEEQGPGEIKGSLEGSYDFKTSKASGEGRAKVTEAIPIEVPWGTFQLDEGGDVEAHVEESELEDLDVRVPFTAEVTKGLEFTVDGEVDGDIDKDGQFTGTLEADLQDDIDIAMGTDGDQLSILQNASVEGKVDKNKLETVSFDFRAQYYDKQSELYFDGNVEDGTYDLTKEEGGLDFHGELNLMKEIARTPEGSDMEAKVLAGAGLEVDVADSKLERVGGQLKFQVHDKQGLLLDGDIKDMDLDVDDDWKVDGTLDVKTGRHIDIPRSASGGGEGGEGGDAGGFILRATQGSGFQGRVEDSEPATLEAQLGFEVHEGADNKLAEGELKGHTNFKDDKTSGSGNVKLVRPYNLTEAPPGDGPLEGWDIVLRRDSELDVQVKDNALQKAKVDVGVDFTKNEDPKARGKLTGEYKLGQEEGYSGSAKVELLDEVDLGDDGRFTFHMVEPTNVEAQASEGGLESASGTFHVDAREGGKNKVQVEAGGDWKRGKGLTGEGAITVVDDIHVTEGSGYDLYLEKDSGGKAKVDKDQVHEVGGKLTLRLDEAGTPKVRAIAEASYKLEEGTDAKIDAQGEMELLDDIKGLEAGEYEAQVDKGTKAGGHIQQGELKHVEGTIKASVKDDQSTFLKAEAQGRYEKTDDSGTVDVEGKVTVTRDVDVVDDPITLTVKENSGGEVKVTKNELTKLGGKLTVQVDDEDGKFVTGELDGSWTKEAGANAWAKGTLEREIQMGEKVGEYTFFVEKGGKGDAKIEQDELTKVGGELGVRVDDEESAFMRGDLKGETDLKGTDGFTGGGKITVLKPKQLGEFNKETLWVEPSTGAQLTISKNTIDEFSGDVKLTLRDDSEYVRVEFSGFYDTGKKAFTGKGGATVTRDKKLFEGGKDYSFWLAQNDKAAAHAEIKANKLTKVGGNVPFMVKDSDPKPLLEGAAQGEYNPETGKFSGKGGVYLGRDVDYKLGGGGKLVFKEGSGGEGTVTDSKLEKLGGTLKVDIHDKEGKLIALEASGEYDAVNNKILWVEGKASLEREYKPLDSDLVVIEKIEGSARVENNELKWAEGKGAFRVAIGPEPMKGKLEGKYVNAGGKESYTGKGELDFTLIKEPDKGREMGGKISAEIQDGGKFKVKGDVDYAINEMIGGKVGVEMDQELDPIINATLNINKKLVDGQELFRLKMDLIPHVTVPIYGPIAFGFGAQAGMGLETRPLMATAEIGISNWKPLSEESNVPTFEAAMGLTWGMDFDALLAAYASLELTAGIGSAGAGVRGEVGIDVDIPASIEGRLIGGREGFFGELTIGAAIEPSVVLRAVPFVYAQLTGFDMIEHDFDALETDLGPIFSFEWGTSYTFGDREERSDAPATPAPSPSADQSNTEHTESPNVPSEQTATPSQEPGGPQLESGSDIAGESGSDRSGGSEMDEMQQKLEQIQVLAEGLGALGYLMELLIDLLTALSVAGPAGLAVMLAWKIISGQLTWDRLVEAVEKVVEAVQTAAEMLRPHLPDWMQGVIDYFSGDQPSLLQALFGADDAAREEVRNGTHHDFPKDHIGAEMAGTLINDMASGYCGGEDEECILELLDWAASSGVLRSTLSFVEGGADHLDYKIDGRNSRRYRRLMDSNGIQYEKSFW